MQIEKCFSHMKKSLSPYKIKKSTVAVRYSMHIVTKTDFAYFFFFLLRS